MGEGRTVTGSKRRFKKCGFSFICFWRTKLPPGPAAPGQGAGASCCNTPCPFLSLPRRHPGPTGRVGRRGCGGTRLLSHALPTGGLWAGAGGQVIPIPGSTVGCPWSPVPHDGCCHSQLVLTTRGREIYSLFGFLKNPHGVLFLMKRKQLWGNV